MTINMTIIEHQAVTVTVTGAGYALLAAAVITNNTPVFFSSLKNIFESDQSTGSAS